MYQKDLVAVKNLSLNIEAGEFVFFVGKTGAGKSTLLKLLSREIKETSGHVLLSGSDLRRFRGYGVAKLRRQMGIVPKISPFCLEKPFGKTLLMRCARLARPDATSGVGYQKF